VRWVPRGLESGYCRSAGSGRIRRHSAGSIGWPQGHPEEVPGYALSPQLQLQWIPHGDHSFKPSRSSGLMEAGNWALAVEHTDRFCRERLDG